MADLCLTCALWDYDRTRPLLDGRVKPDGIALTIEIVRPGQAFKRMLDGGEFHISEMSLANYAMLKARGDCPFVAIPVQVSKMFRHSCIYVREGAGIATPQDLKGKRAGTPQYSATGIVYMRGLLQDEYGVRAEDMEWFLGGLNQPNEKQRLALDLPANLRHRALAPGETLEALFEAGQIDVLFANQMPALFRKGSPLIARLFPNFKQAEQDYYRRTGIVPIMHTIVIRNDVHREHPWVAASLFDAFSAAKDMAIAGLYDSDALLLSLPFLLDHVEESRRVFGPAFWPYGIEADRPSWQALCRYVHEQGLVPRLLDAGDLFVPD